MSSCVLKHLEFLSETGVFETENRMAERCRRARKCGTMRQGSRARVGERKTGKGRAETLPEEKAGLRAEKGECAAQKVRASAGSGL